MYNEPHVADSHVVSVSRRPRLRPITRMTIYECMYIITLCTVGPSRLDCVEMKVRCVSATSVCLSIGRRRPVIHGPYNGTPVQFRIDFFNFSGQRFYGFQLSKTSPPRSFFAYNRATTFVENSRKQRNISNSWYRKSRTRL